MREATPEQRVQALRELRNARRASNGESSTDTRSRTGRVSRFFRRDHSPSTPNNQETLSGTQLPNQTREPSSGASPSRPPTNNTNS
jgi:hypothetical protein